MELLAERLPQWTPTTRHMTETRITLAKAGDLLRMEGKFVSAEKLFRRAARYAEGGAAKHLLRMADHCRALYEAEKAAKARARRRRK